MKSTCQSHHSSRFRSFRPASLFAALLLPALPVAATADQVTFDASGTFTVPQGVIQVTAQAWGAGGGGGGGANANMGGGGGGAYATRVLTVSGNQQYTITVGGGGTGGSNAAGVVGTAGGNSTINLVGNPTILVDAVGGGASNSGTGGTGGAAASCVPVAGAYSGGAGAAGAGSNGGGGGAGATTTANGAAGSGITGGGAGEGKGGDHSSSATPGALQHGAAPGGGGGGKDNGSFVSGNGAAGRIVLTYTVPAAPGTGGIPASQDYNERTTGQLRIAPAATLTDPDSANFGGGYLDVTITTNLESSEDKLYIATANNITLINDQYYVNGAVSEDIEVYHGGTLIGTIAAAYNGFRGNPLRISLNASATVARVQDLLRSIYYQNVDVSNAVANVRTLTVTINDGAGGSVAATTNVNVIAESFDLNSDSTHWTILLEGDNYDPSEDQQAMSGPDLVGATGKPLLYAKYDDLGTPDDQDDVISFRLRVDDSLNSSGLYNGYVFIGYDFELDGDIDCFISLEGTTKGTKTYVYEASGANASPSTTGIGNRYLIPNYNTLTMSNYSKVETIEGGTALANNTYTGSDADPDYYQSFQINFKDLASVLNPLPINSYIDAGTGFTTISQILNIDLRTGLTEITPFRFIIATSTQPNAINSDFGGVGRLSRTEQVTTWEDLDVFEPGASFGNTAPIITTGNDETASYVIAENTTAVANVAAEDADEDSLLYSLLTGGSYGADGAKFRIDPATGALSFLVAPDYEAPTDAGLNNVYEVTIQVDDGKGGYDTQLVYVYVIDVAEGANAQPVITSNGAGATATVEVAENGTAVTTVTSTDGGDFNGAVIAAAATYSIAGGADAALFTINPGTGVLTFNSAPDFESPVGGDNVYNVTVRVTDGGLPMKTDDQALIITVTDVFEPVAPVLVADTPTLPTITEDDITNSGVLVSAVLNGNATDANTGTVIGIAVTGQNPGNGTWQYSMDGGTSWIPVGTQAVDEVVEDDLGNVTVVTTYVSAGAVAASNALLLRSEDRIRFVPNQQNGTTATFNFRAWDESSGFAGDYVDASVTGGVTAFSNVSDVADITATDVNDAPTVGGGTVQLATIVDYQTTAAVSVATILANGSLIYGDVDTGFVQGVAVTATSGAGTWQYSSDGNTWNNVGAVADNSALLLSPSYSVRYISAAAPVDGGETAQLTLHGWDQTGASIGQQGTKFNATATGLATPFSIATFAAQVTVTEDTQAIAISSVTINEASPYATFTLSGVAGQRAALTITNTTTAGLTNIEYYNGSSWVAYTPGTYVSLPVGGSLLVRVAIAPEQEAAVDGGETFRLLATTTGDTPSTGGVATINDDGTGAVYKYANDNTSTPLPSNDPDYPALDDDRPLVVTGDKVNEASPFAVFTVAGVEGQWVQLTLASDTAMLGADAGLQATLEYFNGTSWVDYTAGSFISIPQVGGALNGEAANVLVRVPVYQDIVYEGNELFTLNASTTSGTNHTGIMTIADDGTGSIYKYPNDNTSTPLPPGDPDYPILDDDRLLFVTGTTVNEASPYALFSVDSVEGQLIRLTLGSTGAGAGHATLGTDTGVQADLEYFNGTSWVDYIAGTYVAVPMVGALLNGETGTLLVRVPVNQDTDNEGAETFMLTALSFSGIEISGNSTVVDDGTGAIYKYANGNTSTPLPSNDPDYPALDDDRPLLVTGTIVNEASPFATFTVGGIEGQLVKLTLASGTAALGADTGLPVDLEFFDGTSWVIYTPNSFINIPQAGGALNGETSTVLVRVSVVQDPVYEGYETFTLNAATTSNTNHTGTMTIADDGTGVIYSYPNGNTSTPLNPGDPGYPVLDDDRTLVVTGATVNEASPYGTFSVLGWEGQSVSLTLADTGSDPGDATLGTDTGVQADLEYFNGTIWATYTAGTFITIPQVGGALNGEVATLLVRVPINQDVLNEGAETFALTAGTLPGGSYNGTMTIVDNGTGVIFKYPGPGTPTPLPPGDPDYPALDDDRAPQTICFDPPSSVSEYNPLTLTATADSGLPVSYVVVSGPAALAGDVLTFSGDGDVVVTAVQPGNASYKPAADVTQTIEVIDFYVPSSITDGWTVRYGGEDDLLVRRNSDGKALAMQVVGTEAVAIAATGCTTNISGNRDMFTAKLDAASGETLWSAIHAGTAGRNDEGAAVAIDANGDVWSVGVVTNGSNNTDIYLAKYASADGSLLWERTFKGVNGTDDYGNDGVGGYENAAPYLGGDIRRCAIALTADGGVVVTGYGTNASRTMDALTIKYDADGNLAWTGRYNGPANGYDYGHCVAVDDAGDVFIVGASWGTNPDAIVVKYAGATGVQQWAQRYDGGKPDAAIHMKLDSNGDPVIGGYSQRTTFDFLMARFDSDTGALSWLDVRDSRSSSDAAWDFAMVDDRPIVTGTSYPQNSVFDGYTFRYNCDCSTDAIIWTRPYNGPDSKQDQFLSMGTDRFGNPVVTGYSQNSNGTYDVQTVKYGAEDGAVLWQKRFNGAGNGNDWPRQVLVDPAGNVFIAGFSTNAEGTTDSWVTRYVATEPSTTAAQIITFLQPPTQGVADTLHLTATASSGLPVEFSVVSGPAELIDEVLTFTGTGEVTVRATQPGDATYLAAPAVERTFDVTLSRQIIWFSPPATTNAAVPLSLEALASSGLPVTYEVLSGPATITGNVLTFQGTGAVSVRASQNGNASYAAAASVTRTIVAGGARQTLTFTLPTAAGAGTPLTLNGTASSGLPVAYSISGPAILDGNELRFTGAGTVSVVASQAGSNVWEPAVSVTRSVVVSKSSQTIAFTLPSSLPYTNTVTLSATATSGLPVTLGIVSGPGVINANGSLSFTATGSVTVRATQAGSALFNAAPEVRRIIVASAVKPILDPIVLQALSVSQTINQRITALHTPTKFTATGLPAGVILNATTGVLSGKPTAAKLVEGQPVPYEVTFTAANAAGTSLPVTIAWLIEPLPTQAVGTFNGLVDASTALSLSSIESIYGLGGAINVVTTATGSFTGKLTLETKAHLFSGRLDAVSEGGVTARTIVNRGTGFPSLTLVFSIATSSGELTGTLTDGHIEQPVAFQAWRNAFTSTPNLLPPALEGCYTAALELAPDLQGHSAYPQGNGYVTLKLGSTGTATWAGKLADGTAVTMATTVGPKGQVPLFMALYTPTVPSTAGSVHGWTQATQKAEATDLDGAVQWKKNPQATASTTRSYKGGFPSHPLTLIGGKYLTPTTTVLNLPNVANNARLSFTEGGIDTTALTHATGGELSQVFTITSTNLVSMPLTTAANPGMVRLALTASSGLMTGSFTLKDNDPTDTLAPITVLARTTTYVGVLVPRLGRGVGAFQLAELPSLDAGTTLTTSPLQSGQVILESSQLVRD